MSERDSADTYDTMLRGANAKVIIVNGKGYCTDPTCKPERDTDNTWMHSDNCYVIAQRKWVLAHRRRENNHRRDDWKPDGY